MSEFLNTCVKKEFSDIKTSFTPIHIFIEMYARLNPEKTAIIFDNSSITYDELNNKANYFANQLLSKGIKKGDIVGIYLERGITCIISLLAILKIGAAFFLIDSSLPKKRIHYLVENSKIKFIITNNNHLKSIEHFRDLLIFNINSWKILKTKKYTAPNITINPKDAAYLIYTSGTTGIPKGVLIEHQGLSNTLINQQYLLHLTSEDNILLTASCSFDAFIWEIGGCLISGAIGYLTTNEERDSIKQLSKIMKENLITVATFIPSILRLFSKEALSSLRVLVSAGEVCTKDLIDKSHDNCLFFNAYGPSETSICATIGLCQKDDEVISLGAPLKNTFLYVLNKKLQPVSPGEIGTLYIGGIGLARGYLNDTILTKNKFITNPFTSSQSNRLYNTSDLVRLHNNGALEFIGREDDEIKACGIRINLGEIKHVLLLHRKIKNCIVLAKDHPKKTRQKILAIIETDDENLTYKELKDYLLEYLPSYMLPYKIIKTKHLSLSDYVV